MPTNPSLYDNYCIKMQAARTYQELDAVEISAFRSYVSGHLTDKEYALIYGLGTGLIRYHKW